MSFFADRTCSAEIVWINHTSSRILSEKVEPGKEWLQVKVSLRTLSVPRTLSEVLIARIEPLKLEILVENAGSGVTANKESRHVFPPRFLAENNNTGMKYNGWKPLMEFFQQ